MHTRVRDIGGQSVRFVVPDNSFRDRPPLLLFNGIGAGLELMETVITRLHLRGVGVVAFDVPGTGGSATPLWPYRLPHIARIGRTLLEQEGFSAADLLGVSWGGALAQEFAHQFPSCTRHLVLAATSPGAVMVPGKLSAISRLASPRRYLDPDYVMRVGGRLYGGRYRTEPGLLRAHGSALAPPTSRGYLYQLLATMGWTSLPWLQKLTMPTLVLMGTDDPIVPVVNGRILASMIPHAELSLVDDGHLFLLSQTDVTLDRIMDFFSRTPLPPSQSASGAAFVAPEPVIGDRHT